MKFMHRVSYNETGNVGKSDFDSSVSLYERQMKMTMKMESGDAR